MKKQKKNKKKRTLVFENPPTMQKGKLYEGLIKRISDIDDKTSSFDVILKNLDPTQAGRLHKATLSSKLFDGGQTARFLAAAGQETGTVGTRIDLDDVVGAVVGMRFGHTDGSDKDIEFERIESIVEDKAEDSVVDVGPEVLL